MSVEQTTQLIQLILNSILMAIACVGILSGLLVRYTAINTQLRQANQAYFDLWCSSHVLRSRRLVQLKKQIYQLRQAYKLAHLGLLILQYALFCTAMSTLLLTLRTLCAWSWLIPSSLFFFVVALTILLLGIAVTCLDFWISNRSLGDEIRWIRSLSRNEIATAATLQPHPRRRLRAAESSSKSLPEPKASRG